VALKAGGYGVPAKTVDGMDVIAVEAATRIAVDEVRAGGGPYLLECRTYRFRAHSMYDPELYRTKDEVEEWKKRCPIKKLSSHLSQENSTIDPQIAELEKTIETEIVEAVAVAEAGPWEPVEDLCRDVYTAPPTVEALPQESV
jgi:TPP-dependent pyruvate/acetoin dehydrogenase alpha subunit